MNVFRSKGRWLWTGLLVLAVGAGVTGWVFPSLWQPLLGATPFKGTDPAAKPGAEKAGANRPGKDKAAWGGGRPGAKEGGDGQGKPTPISVAQVQRKDMAIHLEALGTLTAMNTAVVRSQVDGVLKSLRFTEGQQVQAGQLLAELDALCAERGVLFEDLVLGRGVGSRVVGFANGN